MAIYYHSYHGHLLEIILLYKHKTIAMSITICLLPQNITNVNHERHDKRIHMKTISVKHQHGNFYIIFYFQSTIAWYLTPIIIHFLSLIYMLHFVLFSRLLAFPESVRKTVSCVLYTVGLWFTGLMEVKYKLGFTSLLANIHFKNTT